MANSPLNTLMPPSVFALGSSLIAHIDRSNENNGEFPEVSEYNRELFSFPWDELHTTVLRDLLKASTPSEFYRLQFLTLFRIMESGSVDFFCLLIKYGFLNTRVLDDYPEVKFVEGRTSFETFKSGLEMRCGTGDNRFWIFEPYHHFVYLKRMLDFIGSVKSPQFPRGSVKRIRKIIWGLSAVFLDFCYPPPYLKVQCLKIFFDLIREPYITSPEITDIVMHVKGCTKDSVLQKLLEAFQKYFPESCQEYRPRSLKHLCLCQVRENLGNAGKLPHGIQELQLPKCLKEDLLPKINQDVPRDGPAFKYIDSYVPYFEDIEYEKNSPDIHWWPYY